MASSRLPGKVLMDVGGRTMLSAVLERALRARSLHRLVVATSVSRGDDAIVEECRACGVPVFRGSEHDVLDRFVGAVRHFPADAVARITADCPLLDPQVVDETVSAFQEGLPDYASNSLDPGYPRGLDVEVLSLKALERAWREASRAYDRAHVTSYIYSHPEIFRLLSVRCEGDFSQFRWTVDAMEDLDLVREIRRRLPEDFGWRDCLAVMRSDPTLLVLNAGVRQKAVEEG